MDSKSGGMAFKIETLMLPRFMSNRFVTFV